MAFAPHWTVWSRKTQNRERITCSRKEVAIGIRASLLRRYETRQVSRVSSEEGGGNAGPRARRKAHATVTLEVTVSGELGNGNRLRRELAPGIAWFNIG